MAIKWVMTAFVRKTKEGVSYLGGEALAKLIEKEEKLREREACRCIKCARKKRGSLVERQRRASKEEKTAEK